MPKKQIIKILIDILMMVSMILLMSYALIGEKNHEIVGVTMFALFIVHHVFNWTWIKNIGKGKYTPFRKFQTWMVILIFVCMILQMLSAIVISKHILTFIGLPISVSFARIIHMLGAYWGFVLMSVHMGLHLNAMMAMMGKKKEKSALLKILLKGVGFLIIAYGLYAFIKRNILSYMFVQNMFVYFDMDEPRVFFFLDYVAIMGAFAGIGHYVAKRIRG